MLDTRLEAGIIKAVSKQEVCQSSGNDRSTDLIASSVDRSQKPYPNLFLPGLASSLFRPRRFTQVDGGVFLF
jgi:hypothetical protein